MSRFGESKNPRSSRRRRLLGGVAAGAWIGAAFIGAPQVAFAQATAAGDTSLASNQDSEGEIVVTGVRAAIAAGLDAKRNANSIIDSISAEDIGKFPDANIAEAVQRIPGVAIDRSGGEGRFISINGLGPDFSLTLFNGRQIASSDKGRSFSFDTIASNLVSKVNVYKTANANVPEGGLGGTIDIITARPFDYKGFTASVAAAYQYDGNSKKGYPELSFVVADQFLDGRLGLLLSFTHQKRHGKAYQATTSGFSRNYFVDPISEAYVDDTHDEAWRAWDVQYGTSDTYRTRDGGTAVVQFQPTDKLLLTADYLYSRFNVKTDVNTGGAYLWGVQNVPTTIRDSNGVYTQLDIGGAYNNLASYSFNHTITYRPTTTQQGGLNLKWNPSDKLSAVVDGYWSKAVTNNKGLNQSHVLEMLKQPAFLAIFPTDGSVPYFDQRGYDLTKNMSSLRARNNSNSGNYVEAMNKGIRADLDYKFADNISLAFGASYNVQQKNNDYYETPQAIRRLYQSNALGQQIETGSIVSGTLMAGPKFGVAGTPFPVFLVDGDALRRWMADPVNLANRTSNATAGGLDQFIANGRTWNAVQTAASYQVKEQDFSAYADLHLDLEVASMPLNIVGGLRYSQTRLASSGTNRELTGLTPEERSDGTLSGLLFPTYSSAAGTPISVKNKYQNWLPSINIKLEPMRGVIFRGSVSRTMSRPTLEDLAPAVSYGGLSAVLRNGTGSNPMLKPFVSTNLDASAEWYYSPHGALTMSLFHKSADNFILRTSNLEVVANVPAQWQMFLIDRPQNAASAKISGVTASWTHTLDMGFGAQLNYTKVSSKTSAAAGLPTFRVPGVSDTANAVLFFEKYGVSARAAFNWRSRFLVTPGVPKQTEPSYGDAYYQIDARLGYDFGQDLTIGIEGINLTKRKVGYHGQYQNEFNGQYDYGRQFRATISKKF